MEYKILLDALILILGPVIMIGLLYRLLTKDKNK